MKNQHDFCLWGDTKIQLSYFDTMQSQLCKKRNIIAKIKRVQSPKEQNQTKFHKNQQRNY